VFGVLCRGVGPRALSNGINSAVFFCFFEALRSTFKQRKALVRSP
jgi:solute carrier family 25 S-adenosylmethionine transporter 26